MFKRIVHTNSNAGTILIRLMVGAVFVSEGIQKFILAEQLGSGRFEKIGLPAPEFFGPFVGSFEIASGSFILVGFLTRLAAIPTIVIMLFAIALTKSQVLADQGFWEMMHGSRTDWAMLLGSIFLLMSGGGKFSVDKLISKRYQWK